MVTTPVAHLPPVSTTQGELVAKFAPVSLIPVANLPPVSLIPAAICHRCHWHRRCTLICEFLREFSKKFDMILMLLSGTWGKVIHEKNLKQKISWHCPFKQLFSICSTFTEVLKSKIAGENIFHKSLVKRREEKASSSSFLHTLVMSFVQFIIFSIMCCPSWPKT